jgi:dTDP-4-amino-4,6-dideoxygalactose transaminase
MTSDVAIPFLDLATPHEELKEELTTVFRSALKTAGFIGGPMVAGFEEDFARACNTQYCVGVGSGTDALRFILIAAGIKRGDIVVTVPNTFIATTEAISQAGGQPDFVDVCEGTYNLDPARLEEYFETKCYVDQKSGQLIRCQDGRRVAAVVPVHLYGQTAEMDPILGLAKRYNLPVFEDACQAHGAQYFSEIEGRWMKAGSIGAAAAFSFYPGKNLGACGEAGAVTTNDENLAQNIRMLRDHGQAQKYYHDIEGYNGRLDALQAGILQVKLRHLAHWNAQRREAAERYRELLRPAGLSVKLPFEPTWAKAVYHLYVAGVENRDALQKHLSKAKIGTGIHYPIPLHLQNAYRSLGFKGGEFPVAERCAASVLSLPMFPGLGAEQQSEVARQVIQAMAVVEPRPARVFAAAAQSFSNG